MDEGVRQELAMKIRAGEPYRALRERLGSVIGLPASAAAWIAGLLVEDLERPALVVVPHQADALEWTQSSQLFAATAELFPAPSLTPYQQAPVPLSVRAREIATLHGVRNGRSRVIVATARALFRALPAPEDLAAGVRQLRPGLELPIEELTEHLSEVGYLRRDLVTDTGEFAVRGGLVDCFPPGRMEPVRIDYFGDQIEQLRSFDVVDQRSRGEHGQVELLPLRLVSGPRILAELGRALEHQAGEDVGYEAARQIAALAQAEEFAGWENYLSLLMDSPWSLRDWLPGAALTIVLEPEVAEEEIGHYQEILQTDFESAAREGRLAVAPEHLEHSADAVLEIVRSAEVRIDSTAATSTTVDFGAHPTDMFQQQVARFPQEVETILDRGERVLVAAAGEQRVQIERLCEHYVLSTGPGGVEIVDGELGRGFRLPSAALNLFSLTQLFRRPPVSHRRRRGGAAFFTGLRDLRVGDYVVHEDHGIGQFVGLRKIVGDAQPRYDLPSTLVEAAEEKPDSSGEVMEIRYSGGQTLLLPPNRLDLLQRYAGVEGAEPKLDRLGGTSWAAAKDRVRKSVRRLAIDLLRLYAERRVATAPQLPPDSDLQLQFEAAFDFEPTSDQLDAIAEIKADLESVQPMDRLLCGDVGFGKTEVAMRAAFKAVDGGYQVAVLAPTTILADQHFESFKTRFAGFPVEIEMISRFRGNDEIRAIAQRVRAGQVDILIGTHRLLSKDIDIPRLGLLIVDEEQRFGVAQKERFRDLKKSVHALAMSATPVPRTLQLSLAGVRDLSTIETPPRDRLAVETVIVNYSEQLIREAVEAELSRGGQIYYVYNRVADIEGVAEKLAEICPQARIVVGHGQLAEDELARKMHAFKAGEYDVLLATTIIENGIDIPNVNTMLVHRADRFGLAQLYQLRGRVGRSDRLAYCYLLVPGRQALSETSRKRLRAIREFTELGAGFRVAAQDLEIRGAGDLLGAEQSGHIVTVGLETYLKLLQSAVRELQGTEQPEPVAATIDLPVVALIPEEYIGDPELRMDVYRRIAGRDDDWQGLMAELEDRFGKPPEPVARLVEVAELRHRAEALRIETITVRSGRIQVRFRQDTEIGAEALIRFVGETPGATFSPTGVLTLDGGVGDEGLPRVRALLETLAP